MVTSQGESFLVVSFAIATSGGLGQLHSHCPAMCSRNSSGERYPSNVRRGKSAAPRPNKNLDEGPTWEPQTQIYFVRKGLRTSTDLKSVEDLETYQLDQGGWIEPKD